MRLVVAYILAITAASADIVFEKDGTVYFGKIETEGSSEIVLRDENSHERRRFQRKRVLRVLYRGRSEFTKKYLYLTNGQMRHAYVVDEDAQRLTVRTEPEDPAEENIARTDILAISEKELKTTALPYTFEFPGHGNKVAIEGEFTAWQRMPLEKKENRWQVLIPIDVVKKNQYEYRYVVDEKVRETEVIKFRVENEKLVEDKSSWNWSLMPAVGGGLYAGGYAKELTVSQPVMSLQLGFQPPPFPRGLSFRVGLCFFRDTPDSSSAPVFSRLDAETLNFALAAYAAWNLRLGRLSVAPQLGVAAIGQISRIRGYREDQVTNTIPALVTGFGLGYRLTRQISLVIPVDLFVEIDQRTTLFLWSGIGVELRFF